MKDKSTEFKGRVFGIVILISLLTVPISPLFSDQVIHPVTVQDPMPDFTLVSYQGKEVSISDLRGKNIVLIFPRGLAAEKNWCHVCPYQYLDLAKFEEMKGLRENYNVEILFILPYEANKVTEWVKSFPGLLDDINSWKYPENLNDLDDRGKQRMEMAKKYFPTDFSYEEGKIPFPFPILIDAQQKVSKGLGIFREEWSGSKVEQNIPTIIIVDKEGIVQFKYISQNTFDRPRPEYLMKILSCLD